MRPESALPREEEREAARCVGDGGVQQRATQERLHQNPRSLAAFNRDRPLQDLSTVPRYDRLEVDVTKLEGLLAVEREALGEARVPSGDGGQDVGARGEVATLRPEQVPGLAALSGHPGRGLWRLESAGDDLGQVTAVVNRPLVDPFHPDTLAPTCSPDEDPVALCLLNEAGAEGSLDAGDAAVFLLPGLFAGTYAAGQRIALAVEVTSGDPSALEITLQTPGANVPIALAEETPGGWRLDAEVPARYAGRYLVVMLRARGTVSYVLGLE